MCISPFIVAQVLYSDYYIVLKYCRDYIGACDSCLTPKVVASLILLFLGTEPYELQVCEMVTNSFPIFYI